MAMLATLHGKIPARHAVRNAFAARSTTGEGSYYATKGEALNAFEDTLRAHGFSFDHETSYATDGGALFTMHGNEGSTSVAVVNGEGALFGYARFSWYRMPSGRYEFTGYLS